MVVAVIKTLFYMRHYRSLKDKRQFVSSVKATIPARFGVSVAETGLSDNRNRTELGMALVGRDRAFLARTVQALREFLQVKSGDNMTEFSVEYEHW